MVGPTGDLALILDLVDPDQTARRVTVEGLLEAHGATQGLDVDLWTLTIDQADELLATVAAAAVAPQGRTDR